MKRILTVILIFSFLTSFITGVNAASLIQVTVDGERVAFDQEPIIQDGRTLVPLRFISEQMGAEVNWDSSSQTIRILDNDLTITLVIDQKEVTVNKKTIILDTTPILKNGRTLVPIRFISETFGSLVFWDSKNQTVHIINIADASILDQDRETLVKITSPNYFEVKNGQLYFKDEREEFINETHGYVRDAFENYVLKETLNPNINKQIYDLTLALLDEGHYTEVRYLTGGNDQIGSNYQNEDHEKYESRVFVKYALTNMFAYNNNQNLFFIFREEDPIISPLKNDSFMQLRIGKLYPSNKRGTDLIEPHYENKLRSSLVALFGEDGIAIHNYIIDEYVKNHTIGIFETYKAKQSKVFGNVRVDYSNDERPISFYFSYVESDE